MTGHTALTSVHRLSPVKILPWGSSDHETICWLRYSKEPKSPAKTIRKRSYKHFKTSEYLRDVASIDFHDVYCCPDVDDAAELLTQKLLSVLDVHAPWVVYQQRSNFLPWVSEETVKLMKERDKYKQNAKVLAKIDGNCVSASRKVKKKKSYSNTTIIGPGKRKLLKLKNKDKSVLD